MDKSKSLRLSLVFLGVFLPFTLSLLIESPTKEELIPKNKRILEHRLSSKCLTVQTEDYKLFLDNCNWDKGRADTEGVFSVIKSNPGGHLLRWSTGLKPEGIEGCLTVKGDSDQAKRDGDGTDEIFLAECDPRSTVQNWIFEPVSDDERSGDYIVRKYPEDRCLVVAQATEARQSDPANYVGATVQTASCNKEDPEQIWRICENLPDVHKCDA